MRERFCVFLLICLALTSCSTDNPQYEIDISFDPFDNVSEVSYFSPNKDTEDNFIVQKVNYIYENLDIIILYIENQTNENYSITVNGKYLDENGNVLKTETQSFAQFAAGYNNHFLFRPDIQFDDFQYTLEFTKYDGDIYVDDIEVWFEGLTEVLTHIDEQIKQGNHKRFPAITARFGYKSKSDISLCPNGKWIVFGNDNEIVTICPISTWLYANFEDNQYSSWLIHYTTEDELTWPDNLKGELKAIYVLEEILVENAE